MTKYELEDIKNIATLDFPWEKFNNKTILISGGTGFIGQFLINVIKYRNKFFNQNIKIISLSRRDLPSESDVKYLKQDVSKEIKIEENIDYILHLASNTHPALYSSDPTGTIINNVYGCYNLLKLGIEKKITKFLLASSCEIYGNGTSEAMNELSFGYLNCNDFRAGYNEAKRVSESLCQSFIKQYDLDCEIFRLSRVFGADRTKNDSKAMNQFIQNAINDQDIVLKSKGNQRYSYIYVADAVSGILTVLFNGQKGEAYNVSSEFEGLTLFDYATTIAESCGKKVVIEESNNSGASKAIDSILDISKIKKIGFNPIYNVKDALVRTINILKEYK